MLNNHRGLSPRLLRPRLSGTYEYLGGVCGDLRGREDTGLFAPLLGFGTAPYLVSGGQLFAPIATVLLSPAVEGVPAPFAVPRRPGPWVVPAVRLDAHVRA
jgi:hypothetical protein